MKILITGSEGYIAKNIVKCLPDYNYFLLNRSNYDLLNSEYLDSFLNENNFDILIHTAINGGHRLQKDNMDILSENLYIFNNLLKHHNKFQKIIFFGSGAELDRTKEINGNQILNAFPKDPYGLSKNIIAKIALNYENIYNIRIFNVFNEYELNTRMIKYNILNYIYKKPIIVYQNKFMDFFYMGDLILLLDFYINNNNLPKILECCYEKKYNLLDIANIINQLSNYNVSVQIQNNGFDTSYCGNYNELSKLNLNLIGLESGIKNTYKNIIKNL